jgi:hypothetical protein
LSSFPIKTTTTPCEAATSAPGPGTLAHVTTLVPNRCASRTTRSTDLTTASPAPTRSVRLRSPHGFDQGRLGRADACPMRLYPPRLTPATLAFGPGSPLPTSESRMGSPLPTSGSRLGSTLPTSVPFPHLARDSARPCPHLPPAHIYAGTGLVPAISAPGPGTPWPLSAPTGSLAHSHCSETVIAPPTSSARDC